MPPLVPCVCPTFVSAPGVHLPQTPLNRSGLHERYLQARRGWSTAQGRRCAREHQFPLVAVTGLRTGCSLPASVPPLSLRAWRGILYQGAT